MSNVVLTSIHVFWYRNRADPLNKIITDRRRYTCNEHLEEADINAWAPVRLKPASVNWVDTADACQVTLLGPLELSAAFDNRHRRPCRLSRSLSCSLRTFYAELENTFITNYSLYYLSNTVYHRVIFSTALTNCESGAYRTHRFVNVATSLTLWRPLLPHKYIYKASCARPS